MGVTDHLIFLICIMYKKVAWAVNSNCTFGLMHVTTSRLREEECLDSFSRQAL